MDGLRVDTVVLRETGASLRRIAEEFAQANTNSDEVAEAIAHRGLAGAVRSFAHNWDDRREKMLGRIADLAGAASATGETFDHIDGELVRALLGQGGSDNSAAITGDAGTTSSLRAPVALGVAVRRPQDWEPLGVGDPLPGDSPVVTRAADHYANVAGAIATATSKLRDIAADASMRSEAVTAFRDQTGTVAGDVAKAEQRYAAVASALRAYAPALENAQHQALRSLATAREAQDTLARAAIRMQAARAALLPPAVDSPELRSALALEADAIALRDSARRIFESAIAAHEEAGARAERVVNDGKTGDSLGDSRWDNVKGAAIDVLTFVSRAADYIAVGAGILALVTMWCPPLSAFLGSVATYAAVVSLATKLLLQALGEDMVSEIVISAIGLATLGLGRVAIGAFRTSVAGAGGAARATAGSAAATSPAARAAQGLPTQANSAAAMRSMLNTSTLQPRQAATDAAGRSLAQGSLPSKDAVMTSLRALPGETLDGLRAARNLDLAHPIAQLRANTSMNPLSAMGQPGAATELRDLSRIHPVIRGSDEVLPHLDQMRTQGRVFTAAWGGGGAILIYDANRLGESDQSPAERLNLGANR